MGTVEVKNYRAFLQEVVRRFSHGYYLYALTIYPEKKRDKWHKIDEKLLKKYPILSLSKYQRARRKRASRLNARMLRYGPWMILQASGGKDDSGITAKENFVDIRKQKLILANIYGNLSFRIGMKDGKFTVWLAKDFWRVLKAYWAEKASKEAPAELVKEWQKMDRACPSWAGVASQKVYLRKLILKKLRKRGIKGIIFEISPLKSIKVWN